MEQMDLFTDFKTSNTDLNADQQKPKTFKEYHEQNPEIYEAFKRFTFSLLNRGRTHYGARGIIELIRFNSIVTGNDGFKINNNYGAHYARLFMKDYPQHDGFFKCRQMKNV